jgi:hypothetical protein
VPISENNDPDPPRDLMCLSLDKNFEKHFSRTINYLYEEPMSKE